MDQEHLPLLLMSFIFIFFVIILRKKSSKTKIKLPPGPSQFPIIGALHHLLLAKPRRPTHQLLRDLSRNYVAPLVHLKLGEANFVVAASAESTKEITKTHDVIFASRPRMFAFEYMSYGGRDIIFSPYGEYWRQLRKLATIELLSVKRVQSFEFIREQEVFNLIQYIESMNREPVNLTRKLASLMSDITARAAFGNRCESKKEFMEAMDEARKVFTFISLVDLFPSWKFLKWVTKDKAKMEDCFRRVDGVLDGIVQERKRCRKVAAAEKGSSKEEEDEENLLDVLLKLQESGEFVLSNNQVKAIIFDIFQAGTSTSSATMAWAMAELIRKPKTMIKAQAEIRKSLAGKGKTKLTEEDISKLDYLKLVIKETLRLHPPAPLLVPRVCSEPCNVLGYDILPETRVLINAWAIGRDPKYWEEPEEFMPERFNQSICSSSVLDFKGNNFEYIPFGAGRRICPGMQFASTAMEATLARLLWCFDWELPGGADEAHELDMNESMEAGGRRNVDLIVCAKPFKHGLGWANEKSNYGIGIFGLYGVNTF